MALIVDYGMGNLRSVQGALAHLGHQATISADPAMVEAADRLILPGVGSFRDGVRNLSANGLDKALTRRVKRDGVPVLGICLGAQLMARQGTEFGVNPGLGWIDAVVERMEPGGRLRLPHVGWNEAVQTHPSALFKGVPDRSLFYYVHSYHIRMDRQGDMSAAADYGQRFTAAFEVDNVAGTQFHPEKSQRHGLHVLKNFMEWTP